MNMPHDPSAAIAQIDKLLEGALKDIGIPPRPAILERFSIEMRKEEPDLNRLASIINTDVSLGASLIKTANSPFFGTRGRARSVNEALLLLGLNVASRAIAGIILRGAFPASLQLERFWDNSARVARTSGWLVQYLGLRSVRQDEAYTFGLFRDCGIPILLMRFPGYAGVLAQANTEEADCFTDIEARRLPTQHALVGSLMAQSWWLPEETSLAIRKHHDAQAIATEADAMPLVSRYCIALAQVAEYLIQRHTGMGQTREWDKLGTACMQLLDISDAEIDKVFADSVAVVNAQE